MWLCILNICLPMLLHPPPGSKAVPYVSRSSGRDRAQVPDAEHAEQLCRGALGAVCGLTFSLPSPGDHDFKVASPGPSPICYFRRS